MPYFKYLKSTVSPAAHKLKLVSLQYNELRRLTTPIYSVINAELYEEGCVIAGDHFGCMVQQEAKLYAANQLDYKVAENKELLMKIYENIKNAEKAAKIKQFGGMAACLNILWQLLLSIERNKDKYYWMVDSLYKIVVKIAERHDPQDPSCWEIKCRLYCSFGIHLGDRVENFDAVIQNFKNSLEYCRGETWVVGDCSTSSRKDMLLHEFVASQLAKILIELAKAYYEDNIELAVKIAHKAIIGIAELNRMNREHKVVLCEYFLCKIKFLYDSHKTKESLSNIEVVEKRVNQADLGPDFPRIGCHLKIIKGLCHQRLKNPLFAIRSFKLALLIARKFRLYKLEAKSLTLISKLYAEYPSGKWKSRQALYEAKGVYTKAGDYEGRHQVTYVLAYKKHKEIFNEFLRLLKRSGQPCYMYKLRRWKHCLKPFWHEEEHYTTPILEAESFADFEEDTTWDTKITEETMEVSNESFFIDEKTVTNFQKQSRRRSPDWEDKIHCLLNENMNGNS